MSIEYLPHQPIQVYKLHPTNDDLLIGQRDYDNTAYHQRLGWWFLGADYCHPVNIADRLTFQFKATILSDTNLISPFFSPLANGSNTTDTDNHLIDAGANFIGDGVDLNNLVTNNATNLSSFVDTVNSGTDLTLNDDLFPGTGITYSIYPIKIAGGWKLAVDTGLFSVVTASSGGYIELPSALTVGNWYKVIIKVTDITAGFLSIKLGNNTIANISSVGTHVLYGQCQIVGDFQIASSSSFVGEIDFVNSCFIYDLQTDYTIAIFDLDGVYMNATLVSEPASLAIGNVFVDVPYITFARQGEDNLPCGSYQVAVYEGNVIPCSGQMMTNGNFSSASGWSTDAGITITGGHAEFSSVANGNNLQNTLQCAIISGKSYTISWTVADLLGTKTGSYQILVGTAVSPSYNVALQTGTITLTFTAPTDSSFIKFSAVGGSTTFILDTVSLICNDPTLDVADADGLSECICYCNHDDTMLIKYSSNRNTFGQYLTSNDTMWFRVTGRLRNGSPMDESFNPFNSSQLQMVQPYVKMQNDEELITELVPDYVHRCLGVALSHPTVLIDGISYKRIGAYQPNHKDETELSEVIVKVAQTNQSYLENNY